MAPSPSQACFCAYVIFQIGVSKYNYNYVLSHKIICYGFEHCNCNRIRIMNFPQTELMHHYIIIIYYTVI